MVMAITMVKDVFKRPHFQIKPTHIISRFLVPFLLIGIGILFYSSIQKGTLYEFPFSEEEIKEVNFFNILENDSVLVDDEVEIEALFDLFRKMCIDEQLSDVNKTEANFAPLDDFQRRLHGVEERHRAGLAGTEGNRLGNIAEDHIGGNIDLRDLVAAHRDIRQENTPRAVRGCGGGVAAVDLLNFVGHMGNGFPGGNIFLQDFQTGFYIVGEGGLHSTGTGQQGDVLMSAGLDIRLLHRLLGNAVHTGLEIGQCLFAVHGDGGGVAAGQGLHQKGRFDLGEGLRVCLGDFQAGQRTVAGGNSVLLVTVGHVHIDAVGGGVQGIPLRSFHLHECPQTLGDILYLDNAAVFGHITADDLTVAVDVEHSAIKPWVVPAITFLNVMSPSPATGGGGLSPPSGLSSVTTLRAA